MKKYILTVLGILLISFANAQIDTTYKPCLTPDIDTIEFQQLPRFDNNKFLKIFLDRNYYK